jgi:hypothetical protein
MKNLKYIMLYGWLTALVFAISTTTIVNAQFPSASNSSNATQGSDSAAVSATLNVQVKNATSETEDRMLRNSIIGFLTSGPNVLKSIPNEQAVVKTNIMNEISNTTQSVEGVEATNAIVGVELTKAIKSLISKSDPSQGAIIVVSTTSSCKVASSGLICDNAVTLK